MVTKDTFLMKYIPIINKQKVTYNDFSSLNIIKTELSLHEQVEIGFKWLN